MQNWTNRKPRFVQAETKTRQYVLPSVAENDVDFIAAYWRHSSREVDKVDRIRHSDDVITCKKRISLKNTGKFARATLATTPLKRRCC